MTWLDVIERLYPIVAGLLGVGLFEVVKFLFFAKSDKKGKDIENKSKEIDNEGKAIDNESKEIGEYRKLIDTLQDSLIKQSEYYEKLIKAQIIRADEHEKRVYDKFAEVYKIINGLKAENENYKESIAEAYHCPYPNKVEDCPAISKWQLLTNSCTECSHNKHND
jgi:septal ring factor EnvC (AmiA/AmiB activator)